jgi:hypothetical protein
MGSGVEAQHNSGDNDFHSIVRGNQVCSTVAVSQSNIRVG